MIAIVTLFIIIFFSILLTRLATYVLIQTGLSREMARFQARSALSGVGYTTSEAEHMVNHPVRRRVVMLLMLLGNAGIVTVLASLILTFIDVHSATVFGKRMLLLLIVLSVLWGAASNRFLDRMLAKAVQKALKKYSWLDVNDYASLLHLASGFKVVELNVQPNDWVSHASLQELQLDKEGLLILGITRENGDYLAVPSGGTEIRPGDTLLVYGHESLLERLDDRKIGPEGDFDHQDAMVQRGRFEERRKAG